MTIIASSASGLTNLVGLTWHFWSKFWVAFVTFVEVSIIASSVSGFKNRRLAAALTVLVKCFFSCESDSRIANVRLSVCLSVTKTPQLLRIAPIDHQAYWAYWPSSLSTIESINHQIYRPSNLSTIKPINHWAYGPSSLSTTKLINHQVYQPSSLLTIKPIDHQAIDHQAYRP